MSNKRPFEHISTHSNLALSCWSISQTHLNWLVLSISKRQLQGWKAQRWTNSFHSGFQFHHPITKQRIEFISHQLVVNIGLGYILVRYWVPRNSPKCGSEMGVVEKFWVKSRATSFSNLPGRLREPQGDLSFNALIKFNETVLTYSNVRLNSYPYFPIAFHGSCEERHNGILKSLVTKHRSYGFYTRMCLSIRGMEIYPSVLKTPLKSRLRCNSKVHVQQNVF